MDIIIIFLGIRSSTNMGMMVKGFDADTKVHEQKEGERTDDIFSMVAAEHLDRLIQICSEDGMAVLEYEDSGLVFIAEKDGENFMIWQVKKEKR